MRHHSVRKWKDIMRFEIRSFFLEVGRKKYLISNLFICFRFPQAIVLKLYSVYYYLRYTHFLRGVDGGGSKILKWENPNISV